MLPANADVLAQRLVEWFDVSRRALPWRTDRSAYRVWLSEVMLQQTRVAVVEEYFTRFLARFPDVHALAAASEDEVLSSWSGLGYYSRGRNLHRAARAVVAQGGFPSTVAGLRELPGVGDYTASAVASFAFGARSAVVDGNVARVLSRLCDDDGAIEAPQVKQRMHARALALVDAHPVSSPVNEGLMELGALVCTPKSPACLVCPWSSCCLARAHGTIEARPVKAKKAARKAMHVASVIVVDERGRIWLERRASRGLFGGLLEPPSAEVKGEVAGTWSAIARDRAIPERKPWPKPIVVERALTHRDLTFSVVRVDVDGERYRNAPWVADVGEAALSTAVREVLRAAGVVTAGLAPPRAKSRGRASRNA